MPTYQQASLRHIPETDQNSVYTAPNTSDVQFPAQKMQYVTPPEQYPIERHVPSGLIP